MKTLRELKEEFSFIIESSEHNTNYGRAYEIATALHTHEMSGASKNKNPEYQKHIESLKAKGHEAFSKLPSNLQHTALSSAHKSATAYLGSLHKNYGIKSSDVHEVHHTPTGISSHVGHAVDTKANPHDILVKTKSGQMHGASLKAKTGTLSNNSVGSIDKSIGTNLSSHYEKARKGLGFDKMAKHEYKAVKGAHVTAATHKAQEGAANEYVSHFNKMSHEKKMEHLKPLLKAHPGHVPYDYVNGHKGTSTPSQQLPHVHSLLGAKKLTAVKSKSIGGIEIHNHEGHVIAKGEHRPTHSGITSPQLNFKV